MRSQSQSVQAVHGGSVEGPVVDVGLMMMMVMVMVVRRQTHVRQAAVRGEAVTAGGLHRRVMLRCRSPIIAVRVLSRYLGDLRRIL